MAKINGWEETKFLDLILGEKFLLIGSSNAIIVKYFLSDINLFILILLTLIWVGFLEVRFDVGGRGVKLPFPPFPPLSKTH